MKELVTGEDFGDLVVVILLRDNLVKLNLILLERYMQYVPKMELPISEVHHRIARCRRKFLHLG